MVIHRLGLEWHYRDKGEPSGSLSALDLGEEVHVRGKLKKERSALQLTRRFTARGDLKKDRLTLFC